MRKSTFIVAFAASAALVAASAGTSLAAGHAGSNTGHAISGKANPNFHPGKSTQSKKFKIFSQPTGAYLKSCDLNLSKIADFTLVDSVKGCKTKVSFSSQMDKRSVPGSWGTWGSPPDTETDTPNLLYSNGATSVTVDFGKAVNKGGFEVEPNPFEVHTFTVDFHRGIHGGGPIVGTITRDDVDGNFGAKLFGAISVKPFKSAVVTGDVDFAIAQIRMK